MTGPIVDDNGDRRWWVNGALHREDGPAIEFATGGTAWYRDGQLHREGEPAVEYASGNKSWYRDGHLHREDGPAREFYDGRQEWFIHGLRHRADGPARMRPAAEDRWYLHDELLSPNDAGLLADLPAARQHEVANLYQPGDNLTDLIAAVEAAHQSGTT